MRQHYDPPAISFIWGSHASRRVPLALARQHYDPSVITIHLEDLLAWSRKQCSHNWGSISAGCPQTCRFSLWLSGYWWHYHDLKMTYACPQPCQAPHNATPPTTTLVLHHNIPKGSNPSSSIRLGRHNFSYFLCQTWFWTLHIDSHVLFALRYWTATALPNYIRVGFIDTLQS